MFYEELRDIFDCKCATQYATCTGLDEPSTPVLSSAGSSRVSTLKRANICLDLTDEDEYQTDRPATRGGALPPRNPTKPPADVRAVENLQELAIELFVRECAVRLAVSYRLAIKQRLSSPTFSDWMSQSARLV